MKIFFQISLALVFVLCSLSVDAQDYSFASKVSGEGDPIILIPGLTCGGEVFDETVDVLNQNYECHVLTLAGYNGQPPLEQPEGLYVENFKDEIIRYINDKELENITLIGHSIGGFLSQWIATEQPKQLSKVVVIDALPFLAGVYNPMAVAKIDTNQINGYKKRLSEATEFERAQTHLKTAQFMCADTSCWETIVDFAMESDINTLAHTSAEMLGTDLREELAKTTVPILVLAPWVENPSYPMLTKDYIMSTYSGQYKNVPQCEVKVIEESKHFIMYDNFEAYLEELKGFLK